MEALSALMRARPYAFNMLSSAAIAFVGDLLAQRIEHAPPRRQLVATDATIAVAASATATSGSDVAEFELDALRSATICAWSAGVMAPFYTRYYAVMDRVFPLKSIAHIGSKVLITATTCAPVMNGLYLGATTAIEDRLGERPRPELASAIDAKVRAELPGLVLTSAQLWMPVNTLNWMFFPTHARVLLSTVVSVGWNAYISLVQHRPLPPSAAEQV